MKSTHESSKDSGAEDEWSITFQQFMANFLNEPPLVEYFDHKVDLMEGLEHLQRGRLRRSDGRKDQDEQHHRLTTGGSVFYA